jgi:hypothetical protein
MPLLLGADRRAISKKRLARRGGRMLFDGILSGNATFRRIVMEIVEI